MISEKKQQAMIGMVIEALIDPVPGFECYRLFSEVDYSCLGVREGCLFVEAGGPIHHY